MQQFSFVHSDIENPDLYDSGLQDANLSEIPYFDPILTITKTGNWSVNLYLSRPKHTKD